MDRLRASLFLGLALRYPKSDDAALRDLVNAGIRSHKPCEAQSAIAWKASLTCIPLLVCTLALDLPTSLIDKSRAPRRI